MQSRHGHKPRNSCLESGQWPWFAGFESANAWTTAGPIELKGMLQSTQARVAGYLQFYDSDDCHSLYVAVSATFILNLIADLVGLLTTNTELGG